MDKQKILYICLAVLLVVIFVNMNRKTQMVSFGPKQAEEIITREQSAVEPSAYAAFHKSAISIIKRPLPARKEEIKTIPLAHQSEDKLAESRRLSRASSSASGNEGLSAGIGDDVEPSDSPVAGITKINKYPSKEEAKRMNEQGIVMY